MERSNRKPGAAHLSICGNILHVKPFGHDKLIELWITILIFIHQFLCCVILALVLSIIIPSPNTSTACAKSPIKIFNCGTVISLILHQFSAFGLTNNGSGACTKIVHVYYRRYFTKFINILNLKVLNLKNFDCPCFNG